MKPIVTSQRTSASPERLFAVASDFANAAGRIEGILRVEVLTKGPVGVGTRFRETRKMFGKEATEEMEVVAFDPPRGYTLRAQSCGAEYVSDIRCVPDGSGSRVEMEFRCRPISFMAKLMSPLGSLMAGSMKKLVAKDLADLAKAAESAPGPRA